MQQAKEQLKKLIEIGSQFNYKNFRSGTDRSGVPTDYSAEWIAWRSELHAAIIKLFERNSPPTVLVNSGMHERVLYEDEKAFERVKSYFMKALEAAIATIEHDPFGLSVNSAPSGPGATSTKVFIVHGHDDVAKNDLEILLKSVGLEPIVLHRQPDGGKTLIEKFEHNADVGYAFIILTPDEVSYLNDQEAVPDANRKKESRARPNVIFEFGFFVGKLSRARVCCLYRGDVTLPSDVNGLVYKKFEKKIEEVGYPIINELKAAGYSLKL